MKYVYAAILLHETGKEITEENVREVLETANADVNEHRVKALVAALEDVDIEDAREVSAAVQAAQPEAPVGQDEADSTDDEAEAGDESEEESSSDDDDDDGGMEGGEGLDAMF